MTIATTDNRASYTGNGATTAFSYPYPVQDEGDLVVVETVIATGVDTVKTITTHYTVAIASGGGSATVTAVTAPASTVRWTIYRDPALTQAVDLVENDPLPVEASVEAPLDKLTMISQRTRELVTRSLRQPEGDTSNIGALPAKVTRASKVLGFDSNGDPEALTANTDTYITTPASSTDNAVVRFNGTTGESFQNSGVTIDDSDNMAVPGTLDVTGAQTNSAIVKWAKGADIASPAGGALTLGTDGNYFDITGINAITSIVTAGVGTVARLHFDGALVLTHHATDLILPGAANITTAAGDEAEFVEYASGDWRCTRYTKATGRAVLRDVAQVVNTQTGDVATGTTVMPLDDTVPQNTEGDQYMTLAITPTNASSTLIIEVDAQFSPSASGAAVGNIVAALFQDSTAGALAAAAFYNDNGGAAGRIHFVHKMTAGTTSATTFKLRAGPAGAGTLTFNGASGTRYFGGVCASSITITEVLP